MRKTELSLKDIERTIKDMDEQINVAYGMLDHAMENIFDVQDYASDAIQAAKDFGMADLAKKLDALSVMAGQAGNGAGEAYNLLDDMMTRMKNILK